MLHSNFEHLPRGGEQGSTLPLHHKHALYLSSCGTPTMRTWLILVRSSLGSCVSFTSPMSAMSSIVQSERAIDRYLTEAYSLTTKLLKGDKICTVLEN